MAARVVPSANTILEVLNLYNYQDWSIWVETYLTAEGLWDVVKATVETPNGETGYMDGRIKNAKALHAIQNSCRIDVFGFIRGITMAKDAWETLAKRLKPKNTDIEGMATTLVPSVMINLKALNQDNYEHWSFWVKTFLVDEDLWHVVKGINEPAELEDREEEAKFMAWRKSNARALHVITIFCGEDAESSISGIERAKDAWNTLARKFEPPESLVTPGYEEKTYDPLFDTVRVQNWEAAKEFIKQYPEAMRAKQKYLGMTTFQKIVWHENLRGVIELLPFMKKKDWEVLDDDGHTALSLAILNSETDDAIEIVKQIVEKNKDLLLCVVDPSSNTIPLVKALSLDKPKMARYLFSVTPLGKLKSTDGAELVSTGLRLKHLDISLGLLQRFPKFAITKDHSGESPLNELASTRVGLFLNASQLGIWNRWIYSCIHIPPTPEVSIDVQNEEKDQGNRKHLIRKVTCSFGRKVANFRHLFGIDGIYQMKLLHVRTIEILDCMREVLKKDNLNYMQHRLLERALFQAVERGHAPMIKQIITANKRGNRSWFLAITNEHDKTVCQFAAEHRQDKIFDLINSYFDIERKEIVGRKDKFGNNMLHVVGKLSPLTKIAHIRGAAFQMQNELQWFKKVERMASSKDLNCINSDGRTPREEFTMNHIDLVKEGELSMKETASSSSFVGALIITIMFAAVVTVPGGIKGDTGIPIYSDTKAFQIFIVANVISLCCSTTSILASFGILTSSFAEEDFLISLPTRLIIGLFTLFLSIAGMMIAFSSAIFIMLPEKLSIVLPSIVLACVPIASFLWMENKLLIDIVNSTYGPSVHLIYQRARLIYWRLSFGSRRIYWRLRGV